MFMDSEKQRTARAFQHAKVLKLIATLIALGVFILVLGWRIHDFQARRLAFKITGPVGI